MGYKEAPWVFTGRALYQLQLVKADEARKYVPPELKLVELFGYTLGGFYLARYADSPVGAFDEASYGTHPRRVPGPPVSLSTTRRRETMGSSTLACPSRICAFAAASSSGGDCSGQLSSHVSSSGGAGGGSTSSQATKRPSWWEAPSANAGGSASTSKARPAGVCVQLFNTERGSRGLPDRPVCSMQLPAVKTWGFLGPRLQLSLPSFSGGTLDVPGLLKYSCVLHTNVMPVPCTRVLLTEGERREQKQQQLHGSQHSRELLDAVLGGKPLVALAFSDMVMTVDEPTVLELPAPAAVHPSKLAPIAAVHIIQMRPQLEVIC